MARDEAHRSRLNPYSVNPPTSDLERLSAIYMRQRMRTRRAGRPRHNEDGMQVDETPLGSAEGVPVPSNFVLCMVEGVAWEMNADTGHFRPIASDTEMSEGEVEEDVGGAGNDLNAARELIRAEESQQTRDHPSGSGLQATGGSSPTDQPQVQTSAELPGVPSQGVSVPEERSQERPEPLETRIVPAASTRPHSPSTSSSFSTATQNSSGQGPLLNAGGDLPPPARNGSMTPTLRNHHLNITTLNSATQSSGGVVGSSRHRKHNRIDSDPDEEGGSDRGNGNGTSSRMRTPLSNDAQGGKAGPSRHGKGRRVEPFSDEETGAGGGDRDVPMEEGSNHAQYQQHHGEKSRPATEDDILKICQSFHLLTRDFINEVMTELRKVNSRRGARTEYAADDELDGDGPRRTFRKRKARYPGVRRRPAAQNTLSRQIRAHMKVLIHKDDWLKEVINEDDLKNWNPAIRECCTAQDFKLHLKGSPCNPWNSSATRVFVDHFLSTHTAMYPDVWAIRCMVLRKTRAYIKSLIKAHGESTRGGQLQLATKNAKNRRERKTNLFHRCRDITFVYPQLESQRRMLDDLGADGMSSDEEEKVGGNIQYRIIAPRWRSPMLTPWLRIFDILYQQHRLENNSNDKRGAFPRRHVAPAVWTWSTSKRYVSGLPINAYRTEWLEEQLDIPNLVHPAPAAAYQHDPQLAQMALQSLSS